MSPKLSNLADSTTTEEKLASLNSMEKQYEELFIDKPFVHLRSQGLQCFRETQSHFVQRILSNPFVSILPEQKDAIAKEILLALASIVRDRPDVAIDEILDFFVLNYEQNKMFWKHLPVNKDKGINTQRDPVLPCAHVYPNSVTARIISICKNPDTIRKNKEWLAELVGCNIGDMNSLTDGELRYVFRSTKGTSPIEHIRNTINSRKQTGLGFESGTHDTTQFVAHITGWSEERVRRYWTPGYVKQIIKDMPALNGVNRYEDKIRTIAKMIDLYTPDYLSQKLGIEREFITTVFRSVEDAIMKRFVIQSAGSSLEKIRKVLITMRDTEGITLTSTEKEIRGVFLEIVGSKNCKNIDKGVVLENNNKSNSVVRMSEVQQALLKHWTMKVLSQISGLSQEECMKIFTQGVLSELSSGLNGVSYGDRAILDYTKRHTQFFGKNSDFWKVYTFINPEHLSTLSQEQKNTLALRKPEGHLRSIEKKLAFENIAENTNMDISFIGQIFNQELTSVIAVRLLVHYYKIEDICAFLHEISELDKEAAADYGLDRTEKIREILFHAGYEGTKILGQAKRSLKIKDNLDELTIEAIVAYTKWPKEKVEFFFTESQIHLYIANTMKNPWELIDNIMSADAYLTDEKIAEFLHDAKLTTGQKKYVCLSVLKVSQTDELEKRIDALLFTMNQKLTTTYSDENIEKLLGPDIYKQVGSYFTHGIRMDYALFNGGNLIENPISRFKTSYELLTVEGIVENLHWDRDSAQEFLSRPRNRFQVARAAKNVYVFLENCASGATKHPLAFPEAVKILYEDR